MAAGVPLERVRKKTGDKRLGMTADTPGHLLPEADRAPTAAVDSLRARPEAARKATCLLPHAAMSATVTAKAEPPPVRSGGGSLHALRPLAFKWWRRADSNRRHADFQFGR